MGARLRAPVALDGLGVEGVGFSIKTGSVPGKPGWPQEASSL